MTVQALRYNNCKLEYQDGNNRWHQIPTLNACSDGLIIPAPPSYDKRCRFAAYATDQLKTLINNAIHDLETGGTVASAAGGITSAITTGISSIASIVSLLQPELVPIAGATAGFFLFFTAIGQGAADFLAGLSGSQLQSFKDIIDDAFYDYARCQLYCVLDDLGEISPLMVDDWAWKIHAYNPTSFATEKVANLVRDASVLFWQARGLLGTLIPTTFDCTEECTCVPECRFIVGGGAGDRPSEGNITINEDGSLTLELVESEVDLGLLRGTFEMPYYSRCCRMRIVDSSNFDPPEGISVLDNTFAFYRLAGDTRESEFKSLITADNQLNELDNKSLVTLELRSNPNVSQLPVTVTVKFEPCCHDWRLEGDLDWQEISTGNYITFGNIGVYGTPPSGQAEQLVGIYLAMPNTNPHRITFDKIDSDNQFTVYQSDTIPTTVPADVSYTGGILPCVDVDGFIVTHPYVIVTWKAKATTNIFEPVTNLVLHKFCLSEVRGIYDERFDATASAPWTAPNGRCRTALNLRSILNNVLGQIFSDFVDGKGYQGAVSRLEDQIALANFVVDDLGAEISDLALLLHQSYPNVLDDPTNDFPYNDFECVLYKHGNSANNGVINETNYAAIITEVQTHTGTAWEVFEKWLNLYGPVGLTRMGAAANISSGDCSACDWCRYYDFTTGQQNWGLTTGQGTYITGQGFGGNTSGTDNVGLQHSFPSDGVLTKVDFIFNENWGGSNPRIVVGSANFASWFGNSTAQGSTTISILTPSFSTVTELWANLDRLVGSNQYWSATMRLMGIKLYGTGTAPADGVAC